MFWDFVLDVYFHPGVCCFTVQLTYVWLLYKTSKDHEFLLLYTCNLFSDDITISFLKLHGLSLFNRWETWTTPSMEMFQRLKYLVSGKNFLLIRFFTTDKGQDWADLRKGYFRRGMFRYATKRNTMEMRFISACYAVSLAVFMGHW